MRRLPLLDVIKPGAATGRLVVRVGAEEDAALALRSTRGTTFWPHRHAARVQHMEQQQSRLRLAFGGRFEACPCVHARQVKVVPKIRDEEATGYRKCRLISWAYLRPRVSLFSEIH